jgi:hypothetical protein
MAYERREMTAKFVGRIKEGARYVYQFENPQNPQEKPIRLSAFDAKPEAKEKHDAPKLAEDTYYTMTVEDVPTKDDPSKFHHNIAREQIAGEFPPQGKYMIRTAAVKDVGQKTPDKQPPTPTSQSNTRSNDGKGTAPNPSPKSGEDKEEKARAEHVAQLQKENAERIAKEAERVAKMKADNDKAIAISTFHTRRGGLAHDAAQLLASLIQSGAIKPEQQREAVKLTAELHAILTKHLMDDSAREEAELVAKLELGSLKPQKASQPAGREPGPESYVDKE